MTDYARNQCPARGPGLTHTLHGREGDPCVECGEPLSMQPPRDYLPPTASQAGPPPEVSIDVVKRMRDLGFAGAYRDITGAKKVYDQPKRDSDRDNVLVEPRMVSGTGPDGVTWGLGRGSLTPRQIDRLIRVAEQEAWLDEHRPIEGYDE